MSLAAEITPHIPYLRRFARALTGAQSSGDAYVAAVLEALVSDAGSFPKELGAKVGLYKSFITIWKSIDLNLKSDPILSELSPPSTKKLQAITPAARQAFLLTTVEDFSHAEAAAVLDVAQNELEALLDQANREIAAQVATSVMIIEDEPIIAMDIESMVEDLGHSVTGIARTHKEAIALFKSDQPGIVLADIQLADGSSGLEAVNELLEDFEVPVIFITAFPERLLTGQRPEPAFLVTKPFQPDMVRALISQALFFSERDTSKAA
ncbi:response regulator [Pararhizobium sp. IMCC21322]|uniref:response regulator n=1 Tax=Pararhizobium sp. IMCC21322 TaxID=3067903 RepID=UPI0027404EA1|nr:response regulator [Pararhizobium sp. IMCC21322]